MIKLWILALASFFIYTSGLKTNMDNFSRLRYLVMAGIKNSLALSATELKHNN
jgi:hypothetical protein